MESEFWHLRWEPAAVPRPVQEARQNQRRSQRRIRATLLRATAQQRRIPARAVHPRVLPRAETALPRAIRPEAAAPPRAAHPEAAPPRAAHPEPKELPRAIRPERTALPEAIPTQINKTACCRTLSVPDMRQDDSGGQADGGENKA